MVTPGRLCWPFNWGVVGGFYLLSYNDYVDCGINKRILFESKNTDATTYPDGTEAASTGIAFSQYHGAERVVLYLPIMPNTAQIITHLFVGSVNFMHCKRLKFDNILCSQL